MVSAVLESGWPLVGWDDLAYGQTRFEQRRTKFRGASREMRPTSDPDPAVAVGNHSAPVDVVIAVRGGPSAKTRLADRLGPAARERLVSAMLMDMLAGLSQCPGVRRVRVSTPTDTLARTARAAGALVIDEAPAGGLNHAFEAARREIAADAPGAAVILLPGDAPLIDPAEVQRLVAAVAPGRIAIAPAQEDGGTAALVLPAGLDLDLAFGPDSFARHLAAAGRSGVGVDVLHLPGLGLDIDRPSDIDSFQARGGGGQTALALLAGRERQQGAAA